MSATIEPGCHEFNVNWIFDKFGLKPFFAFDSRVKDGDGKQVKEFTDRGERWVAKLLYQPSGVVPPESGQTPTGTEWALQEPREFRLKVYRHPDEDPKELQSFNVHIAPRWRGMIVENKNGDRKRFPVPPQIDEAINVDVRGSNVDFLRYRSLLQKGADAVGVASKYVDNPNLDLSNTQDAETYIRIHRDKSGPIHARDGPLARMGHLLEDDRSGYRKVVQDDRDINGEKLPGYYHTTTLDERRVREAFPTHQIPKENKHYYSKHAKSMGEDNDLAHPKVGASMQVSLLDRKYGASQEDLKKLKDELDQTVLSLLVDAGIDIHSERPFVADSCFDATLTEDGPEPVDLPLAQIESDQNSIVVRHISDGLSPVQWESLETLVTDGGEVSPQSIADQHDRHVESVRRALREMEDLVHRGYAEVSLRSDHIAEMVHEAVKEAREGVKRAVDTSAKALHAAEKGMDRSMSSLIAWAARHDIDMDDALNRREARLTLRFGEHKSRRQAERAIREGFELWQDAGLPEERFRSAQVRFGGGGKADAWRYLRR